MTHYFQYISFSGEKLFMFFILIIYSNCSNAAQEQIEFNTDVLDVADRSSVDLSKFSAGGYIMPGKYPMVIQIGESTLPEQLVEFYAESDDKSLPCVNKDIVDSLGFKKKFLSDLKWVRDNQCLDLSSLKGFSAKGDLSAGALYINVPQAYVEYVDENWEPSARWDEGLSGVMLDYNINAQQQYIYQGDNSTNVSANGVLGLNAGPWRLRADWQEQYEKSKFVTDSQFDFSRFYAYRALKDLQLKLVLGEDYFRSDVFDSFRFAGLSVRSDDSMLPPGLRGYAPEVRGIAQSNAKVTVSQKGRIIYQTQVAAGPFRIQDLGDTVNGKLDVKVQEEDGSVNTFQVDTAYVPYLTRPGTVRYKFASGRPSNMDHSVEGPLFASTEATYGVNNGWSIYGGGLFAKDYGIGAVGIGRDLLTFGAISLDISQSKAQVREYSLSGRSYRINYSKTFSDYDSQITFAGYRFSDKDFLSMDQFIDLLRDDAIYSRGRELYTVTFNQQLKKLNLNFFLNYSRQTYWDRQPDSTYSLTVSRYFDIGNFKNVNVSLSATKTKNNYQNDETSYYLGMSIPIGDRGSIGYNLQEDRGKVSTGLSYYNAIDDNNSYQVRAGLDNGDRSRASGYFQHDGDMASVTASAGYYNQSYRSLGLSMEGGMTATTQGIALHRINSPGDTRIMLDTGVAGIPVRAEYGGVIFTNRFGKAVSPDVQSYYKNSYYIDLNKLPDNAEAIVSLKQSALTEGAIGYQSFNVLAGSKAMAVIRFADGSYPPFGAMASNLKDISTGMVADNGVIWLAGMNPDETMKVAWGDGNTCEFTLPHEIPTAFDTKLLLLCK